MILSDREIAMEIESGMLRFEPGIERAGAQRQIGTSAVDLRLGHRFRVLRRPEEIAGLSAIRRVDPVHIGDFAAILEAVSELTVMDDEPFLLEPDPTQLVIAETYEFVSLPPYLAARVEGRSSLARLGLSIHNTAPTVHAGFRGRIALELTNRGPLQIALRPKILRICQLIFERLGTPPMEEGGGRFRGQVHV